MSGSRSLHSARTPLRRGYHKEKQCRTIKHQGFFPPSLRPFSLFFEPKWEAPGSMKCGSNCSCVCVCVCIHPSSEKAEGMRGGGGCWQAVGGEFREGMLSRECQECPALFTVRAGSHLQVRVLSPAPAPPLPSALLITRGSSSEVT